MRLPSRCTANRAQQVDGEAGGLQVRIDTGPLDAPAQEAADDLASHGVAPRPARQVRVAVDSEERLGHDGEILDRHRHHDRAVAVGLSRQAGRIFTGG